MLYVSDLGTVQNVTCGIKRKSISFYISPLSSKNERRLKSYHTHPTHVPPPHLHAPFMVYFHNVKSQILFGNDITTEIDFKRIVYISTWVWEKVIEKNEMVSLPLRLISFCTRHAT